MFLAIELRLDERRSLITESQPELQPRDITCQKQARCGIAAQSLLSNPDMHVRCLQLREQ